ncbi:hypothetical protein KCU75_g61, partial [Aureobasidium melanogenum]
MRFAKRLIPIPPFLTRAPKPSLRPLPQHDLPQRNLRHLDRLHPKPLHLIHPHIITMDTLKPFLHNRIQATRLIEVCLVDRGHNRGIIVCKLDEPLIPLFLEESTEWHSNGLVRIVPRDPRIQGVAEGVDEFVEDGTCEHDGHAEHALHFLKPVDVGCLTGVCEPLHLDQPPEVLSPREAKMETSAPITIVVRSHLSEAEIHVELHIPYCLECVTLLCFSESVWDVRDLAGEVCIGVDHCGHGACWLAEGRTQDSRLVVAMHGMNFLSWIPCRISIRIVINTSHWTKGYRIRRLNTIDEASGVQNFQSELLEDRVIIWCLTRRSHGIHFRPFALETSTHACRIIIIEFTYLKIGLVVVQPDSVLVAYIGPELQGKIAMFIHFIRRLRRKRDIVASRAVGLLHGDVALGRVGVSDGIREQLVRSTMDLLTRFEAISFSNTPDKLDGNIEERRCIQRPRRSDSGEASVVLSYAVVLLTLPQ